MKRAGYDQEGTIMATAVTCCIGMRYGRWDGMGLYDLVC